MRRETHSPWPGHRHYRAIHPSGPPETKKSLTATTARPDPFKASCLQPNCGLTPARIYAGNAGFARLNVLYLDCAAHTGSGSSLYRKGKEMSTGTLTATA